MRRRDEDKREEILSRSLSVLSFVTYLEEQLDGKHAQVAKRALFNIKATIDQIMMERDSKEAMRDDDLKLNVAG
jgi:hypothetical protein